MSKTIKIPGRIESVATGKVVTGANFILDDTKGKKQNVINEETDAELLRLDQEKQGNLTFDQTPTEGSTNPVTSGGVYAADQMLSQAIEAILLLIPSAASELNKLVDLATMNSSISTATASFKGTYNLVSDLHLTVPATHAQIAAALDALSLGADNNDYAFVQVPNTDTAPTDIAKTERYKFNGENWAYEYDLNNSGFTTAQWNAINSGITTLLVAKLSALPTNEALTLALAGKQDSLTFDNAPTAGSNNPVKSGGIYTRDNEIVALINALDAAKQDVLVFDTTPTNGSTNPVTSNGVYLAIQLVQTAVVALDGRMGTAETKISTAEGNIANLQAAYAALTQSDIVVVSGALPSSGQQQNIIYRQPDQDHTPPQFYSDYMWNGTTWVLMATYNNAIDPRPKKGSQNLVTSGGVFDNMGALDVSELNATENPHTLKPYATLDAALADIPSDYQKGGMSIKYVQTSDNKYVQYRLMSDEWSTDTDDWSLCGNNVLVENPEFSVVWLDKNKKILFGVQKNANFFFGAGVPQQVVDYVEGKIAELSLDEYEDIVAFLGNLITGDKMLETLLNEKVDKESGKSLIDEDFSNSVHSVENPEYLSVVLDNKGRILEGVRKNGVKYIAELDCPSIDKTFTKLKEETIQECVDVIDGDGYKKVLENEQIDVERRAIPYSIGTTGNGYTFDYFNRFNLLFFTDNHIDMGNGEYSLENVKDTINFAMNTKLPIHAIADGGDIVSHSGVMSKENAYLKINKYFDYIKQNIKIPFIQAIGNHDSNDWHNFPAEAFKDEDWYNLIFRWQKDNFKTVHNSTGSYSGQSYQSPYFYKDFDSFKIRIICLYDYDYPRDDQHVDGNGHCLYYGIWGNAYIRQEQFDWFVNVALNFDNKAEKDWGVIIISHSNSYNVATGEEYGIKLSQNSDVVVAPEDSAINKVLLTLNALNTQSAYSNTYVNSIDSSFNLSVDADFSSYAEAEEKPYVIAYLCGHEHFDAALVVNGINVIITDHAGAFISDGRVNRIGGTSTQNCFDIFSIDTVRRKIYSTRYGAGLNCYGNGGDRFKPEGLGF